MLSEKAEMSYANAIYNLYKSLKIYNFYEKLAVI